MYDRPTLEELLDAVRLHLEAAVIPAVREDRKLYFQTLVAINVLKIAERELQMGGDHIRAEWVRLNSIEGVGFHLPASDAEIRVTLAERNSALCDKIRAGDYDDSADALLSHLKSTAIEQLQVANPNYLKKLMLEDQNPALDAWHHR
jgi:Domain of unknown function (DUF6285)